MVKKFWPKKGHFRQKSIWRVIYISQALNNCQVLEKTMNGFSDIVWNSFSVKTTLRVCTLFMRKWQPLFGIQRSFRSRQKTCSKIKFRSLLIGERHVGAVIGSEDFKATFVTAKIEKWIKNVRKFSKIAKEQPQHVLNGCNIPLS